MDSEIKILDTYVNMHKQLDQLNKFMMNLDGSSNDYYLSMSNIDNQIYKQFNGTFLNPDNMDPELICISYNDKLEASTMYKIASVIYEDRKNELDAYKKQHKNILKTFSIK